MIIGIIKYSKTEKTGGFVSCLDPVGRVLWDKWTVFLPCTRIIDATNIFILFKLILSQLTAPDDVTEKSLHVRQI